MIPIRDNYSAHLASLQTGHVSEFAFKEPADRSDPPSARSPFGEVSRSTPAGPGSSLQPSHLATSFAERFIGDVLAPSATVGAALEYLEPLRRFEKTAFRGFVATRARQMNVPSLTNHAMGILVLVAMLATAGAFMFAAIVGVIILWLPVALIFALGLLQVAQRSTRHSW